MSIDEAAAWRAAGALITHKMLGELSYEHMLEPVADGDSYRLELPDDVTYTFRARRGAFDAWTVVAGSAHRSGEPTTDPRTLVVDARKTVGLSGLRLADVLAELTATVANEAARLRRAPTAAELSTLDYNVADGHLTGHPRLVLNKGRVGFSALDRARFAPEAGADVRLRWFAVHPEHAEFRCVDELSRDALLAAELGDLRAEFADRAPDDYVWVPVHPWQADEILGTLYAAELATGVMIDLGESADGYRAHQTVRTLANVSTPSTARRQDRGVGAQHARLPGAQLRGHARRAVGDVVAAPGQRGRSAAGREVPVRAARRGRERVGEAPAVRAPGGAAVPVPRDPRCVVAGTPHRAPGGRMSARSRSPHCLIAAPTASRCWPT